MTPLACVLLAFSGRLGLGAFAAGIAAFLGGCALQPDGWHDVPTATITPYAPDADYELWEDLVIDAAEEWNASLEDRGCAPPFRVGPGGHAVTLIAVEDWTRPNVCGETHDSVVPWLGGWLIPETIEVSAAPDCVGWGLDRVLRHELGHAIGLPHVTADVETVMAPTWSSDVVQGRDAAAAACLLGCGPCEDVP
jgi:hypothetical protein